MAIYKFCVVAHRNPAKSLDTGILLACFVSVVDGDQVMRLAQVNHSLAVEVWQNWKLDYPLNQLVIFDHEIVGYHFATPPESPQILLHGVQDSSR